MVPNFRTIFPKNQESTTYIVQERKQQKIVNLFTFFRLSFDNVSCEEWVKILHQILQADSKSAKYFVLQVIMNVVYSTKVGGLL